MIELINLWFKRAVPQPTPKNQAVQLGVHFEEVAEMALALGDVGEANIMADLANDYKHWQTLKRINRNELLDSLCDQIVTAVGVAHMFGMDIEGALQEVTRSNWSKFDENDQPLFDENGKIKKGSRYIPPDLNKFI